MPTSSCRFTNDRGQELSARLHRPEGPVRATAVFAHCFTCGKNITAARRISAALCARGYAVLSFDFAGLGSSDGEFAESTFSHDVADLVAAAGYLEETIAAPRLLVGHSLGGAAVLVAAGRLDQVAAVATVGAPADVTHVEHLLDEDDHDAIRAEGEAEVTIAGRSFTVGSSFLDDLGEQHLLDGLAELDAALLLLHAPLDDTVGIGNARRIFEAARHPKSFVSLDGADHLLGRVADAEYVAHVAAAWAARYLPDAPADVPSALSDAGGDYDEETVLAVNTGGLGTDVTSRGYRMRVDEPADLGGEETGPTPYEYLGAALASCTSMTVRMYAQRKDLPLDEVRTSVEFSAVHAEDCAECDHREGRVERFDRRVELIGGLDDEARNKLLEIADKCPVHRTLEGQIEIHTTLV